MKDQVAVVGGGWAGLAAAVELTRRGVPVTVFEAARQLGGRARRVAFGEHPVDNGQHLLIGAYHRTLELLRVVGVPLDRALHRVPLELPMRDLHGGDFRLSAARLPAPLHLLAGLLRARGLSVHERLAGLRLGLRLRRREFGLSQDRCVSELLSEAGQPPRLVQALWAPLCLAALNTPPEQASARVFLRVLHDALMHQRADSDLLFTAANLGALLPDPALDYIESHGGRVVLGRRVEALEVRGGRVCGVRIKGERQAFAQVVIATSAPAAARLLGPHPLVHECAAALARLEHQPICTVYLHYPDQGAALPGPMMGLLNATGHWIFDRRINGQPGLMAVVISGPSPALRLDNAALAGRIRDELARLFPHWPAPRETLVIREKRATFSCDVPSQTLRPGVATALPGCWLAGDYTDTGYPGTLEGAVRSGVECARAILTPPTDRTPPEA